MPGQEAKYTVMIPLRDNLGNQLPNLSTAAHHLLWKNTGVQGSYITGPHKGNWENSPQEEFEHLVTVAPDTPENDSHIKNLAHTIAEAANQWGVFVMKEGKGGIQSWVIDNPGYTEGHPAPLAQANGAEAHRQELIAHFSRPWPTTVPKF